MMHLQKKSLARLAGAVLVGLMTAGPMLGSSCEAAEAQTWDFASDAQNWSYIGGWSYSGQAAAAWDSFNGGSLKVNVDFSKDKDQTWSEVKLSDSAVTDSTPIKVGTGISTVSFDLFFDPTQIKGDSTLKAKIYAKSVKGDEVINQSVDGLNLAAAKAVPGSNLKRVHVKAILDDPVSVDIGHLEISLVSYLTSYKGDLYLDDITLR